MFSYFASCPLEKEEKRKGKTREETGGRYRKDDKSEIGDEMRDEKEDKGMNGVVKRKRDKAINEEREGLQVELEEEE